MPETRLLLLFVAISSLSTAAMAVAILVTAADLRRALRRVAALAPDCERTMREARHVLRRSQRLLVRADRAGRQVAGAVESVCAAVSDIVGQWLSLKERAGAWFHNGFGHPARLVPRVSISIKKRWQRHRRAR